jgi:D-alanyl-lipoteichoic acid acyltransferase DltB (MBOAT superfamily)
VRFFICNTFYADFSGYSIWQSRLVELLGFNITRNFNYPFFAQNIADFFSGDGISLTSWMTGINTLRFQHARLQKCRFILAINFILVAEAWLVKMDFHFVWTSTWFIFYPTNFI